jgi:hypothetical protein
MSSGQSISEMQARLHEISERLRQAQHLGPEAQQDLAELVDELGKSLDSSQLPMAELTHLTDSAAHLLRSLEPPHNPSQLTAAKERMERAIFASEAQAPFITGIARRLLEVLASIGI